MDDPRRWKALMVICVAQFMLILDLTVVNVALPDLGTNLGLTRTSLTWAVSAYVLFFGGLMLLGGRFADVFGTRRVMLTGLIIFTRLAGDRLDAGRVAADRRPRRSGHRSRATVPRRTSDRYQHLPGGRNATRR